MKRRFQLTIGDLVCFTFVLCGAFGQTPVKAAGSRRTGTRVPFVGCPSDGQVGAVEAPSGKSKVLSLRADVSGQLAYYKAKDGMGVLAPRHWHCFGTYGSNGSVLYVSPEPINDTDLFSATWSGFSGQVIQVSTLEGDTSGRFDVAKKIARVFPARRTFVSKVIAEEIEPAASFPSGPYPDDKLAYKSKDIVEFETPRQKEGLGTASRLQKNEDAICGVVILAGQTPDLVQASLRITGNQAALTPWIIRQLERDVGHTLPAK